MQELLEGEMEKTSSPPLNLLLLVCTLILWHVPESPGAHARDLKAKIVRQYSLWESISLSDPSLIRHWFLFCLKSLSLTSH